MRLVMLALGWSAGLALAAGLHPPAGVWAGLLLGCIVLTALLWRRARWPALALAALALGGLRFAAQPEQNAISAYNDRGGLTLEGIVAAPPALSDGGLQIRLDADMLERGGVRIPVTGTVLVRAAVTAEVEAGSRVRATGLLTAPRLIGDLDYGAYLARSGVQSLMRDAAVEILAPPDPFRLDTALARLRESLAAAIQRVMPPPQSGLLVAMLLGDESGLAPDTEEAFAVTGTAHLVAISGFNMLVISSAVQAVLLRLRVRRRWAAAASVAVILGYTLLVGASPAVVRAALMSGLLVIGQSLRRRTFIASSLAFAVLIITLINPLVLWDIGFQLSLLAALGIALLAAPFSRAGDRAAARLLPNSLQKPASDFVNPVLGTTLAAQLTVLPLIALVFGRVSLISPLVNLLVAPAQSALLLTGAAGAMLALLPSMPALVLAPAWLLLSYTTGIIHTFARIPLAEISLFPGAGAVALFYVCFIVGGLLMAARPTWLSRLVRPLQSRPVAVSVLLGAVGVLVLTGARLAERSDSNLHLWFLDMDGESAVLVRTPGGANLLVDGGSHPARLLTSIGDHLPFDDREIELWAITQPSLNRIQSAGRLLEQYTVKQVLTNGQPILDGELAALLDRAGSGVPLRAGQRVELSDGTVLEVVHPAAAPGETSRQADGALALRLSSGEISILLTGDLSADGQAAMMAAGYGRPATVLQAPAGGAESSLLPELITVTQPQVIIVQTRGEDSNEPAPETLELLGGIPVYQTGSGGVHLWSDGRRLWAEQEG
ncbi:MAG: ComEC/Rec2 family competence protein [Anaerolineae bacterium]|nr:ComEC/Rec2 family competence protein [Anaerolineae bacterium]